MLKADFTRQEIVKAILAEMRAKLETRTSENAPVIDASVLSLSSTLALITRESSLPFPELEGIKLL
jgi:hypothetical protein